MKIEIEASNNDGITNINGYILWNKAIVIKSYVKDYLKITFPKSLILSELNQIDLVVLDESLPVEIQSTPISKKSFIVHTTFENSIRKQLEDNIENYGKCWFFFDAEYHRYLKETNNKNISINLDWLSKYVKDDKLKIFTVRYDGLINELKYEDLEFIKKLSNTCMLEYNNDDRTLNRNKLMIMNSVLKGNEFKQEEIDKMMEKYNNRTEENKDCTFVQFLLLSNYNREKIYSNILMSIGNLNEINDILNMNPSYKRGKSHGGQLGIFDLHGNSDRTEFVDKFDICKYFPGYLRNKENWNSLRTSSFSDSQLRNIFYVKNKHLKTLMDY